MSRLAAHSTLQHMLAKRAAANPRSYWALSQRADSYTYKVSKPYAKLIRAYVHSVAKQVESGESLANALRRVGEDYQAGVEQLKVDWSFKLAIEAYKLAGKLVGRKAYERYEAKQIDVDTSIFGRDELVAQQLKPNVTKWITETSRLETQYTAQYISDIVKSAMVAPMQQRVTLADIADAILDSGIAETTARAVLLARTTTIWSYGEGASLSYQEAGFENGVWVATEDDLTCEYCAEMNDSVFALGSAILSRGASFRGMDGGLLELGVDVEHPPLHPNCRCTIMPEL